MIIENPEISVVMSVYNGLPFLEESIISILNQTYGNFEFIIIDDASTDLSREIIKKYAILDNRIIPVYNHTNLGKIALGFNMANGVSLAKGKYIARMDSDDIALPKRFEQQKNFLDTHQEVDILGTWAIDINEKSEIGKVRSYPTDNDDIYKLLWTCPIIHPTVMFRKESILRVGNYSTKSGRRDDYELWFRSAKKGLKFANLPQPLLQYRFFSDFYKKNNLKVVLKQTRIGLYGCWSLKLGFLAYMGTIVPLFRALLPYFLRKRFHSLMNKIDPRITSK